MRAAAVCEHLSELTVSQSLEGRSQQLLSAEVVETAEGCQIEVEVLAPNNSGGWESVIPANHTVYGDLERQRFYSF